MSDLDAYKSNAKVIPQPSRKRICQQIGTADDETMLALSQVLAHMLGMAGL